MVFDFLKSVFRFHFGIDYTIPPIIFIDYVSIKTIRMKTLVETTKCIFCDGHIPASYDQVYINHMNDHHRAFVNIEFLYQLSLLGFADLDSLNVNFDLKITSKFTETLPANQSVIHDIIKESDLIKNFDHNSASEDPEQNIKVNEYEIKREIPVEEKERLEKIKDSAIKKKRTRRKSKDEKRNGIKSFVSDSVGVKDDAESNYLEELKEEKDTKGSFIKKEKKGNWTKTVCHCNIKFKNKGARLRHNKIVHKNWFACDQCKRGVYEKEEDLILHLKEIHPNGPKNKSNICDDCGFVVPHWYKMAAHKADKHDYSIHQCEICAASIQGKRTFKRHLNKHERKKVLKQCLECNKLVKDMDRHKGKMHLINELKPFACENCEKRFAFEFDLRNHMLIHSDLRPFICRYGCGFGSKSAGNRTKHENNKHINI